MKGSMVGLILVLGVVVLVGALLVWRGGPEEGPGEGEGTVVSDAPAPVERTAWREEAPAPPDGDAPLHTVVDEGEGEAEALVAEGLALYRQGKRAEANRVLVKALPKAGKREAEVLDALRRLGRDLFLEPVELSHLDLYTVKRKDSLWALSRRNATTIAMIRRLNGMRPDQDLIQVGQKLALPPGGAKIFIWKGKFRLMVMVGPYYVAHYPIGIGRLNKTPAEKFAVHVKQKNPDWYPLEGGVVRYGDPGNPLGTRWIGFSSKGEPNGLGIHGTRDEDSIGKRESKGCVRLRNRDVEELYVIVPIGTTVVIYD